MSKFFIHIFLAVVVVTGVVGFCGNAMAAAPVLNSLSPNPALVGQVVTISGSGFSMTNKILVDNIFVSPVNVAGGGKILTFIVPPGTPVRDSGIGVSVKSGGEYSMGLNLKVVSQLAKAKPKVQTKKVASFPKKTTPIVVREITDSEEAAKKNELAQALSTLQLLVFRFYQLFGR